MRARFDAEQPDFKTAELGNGKTAVFLCANGEWKEEETETGVTKYWECDYHEIIGNTDDIPLNDIKTNPSAYMDFEVVIEKPVSDEIEELKRSLAELISKVYKEED